MENKCNDYKSNNYVLCISVEGRDCVYELAKGDIFKVFSRYGIVKDVEIFGSKANICFCFEDDAKKAQRDLDGKELNGLDCHLSVDWVNLNENTAFSSSNSKSILPNRDNLTAPGNCIENVKKFTVQYEVQIEAQNGFDVAKRIIGLKGINMKRIFEATHSKLRLRGKGSGYLEGVNLKEADDPLHLCISSESYEDYMHARKLVEELLEHVYSDYDEWLITNNSEPKNLKPKLVETLILYSCSDTIVKNGHNSKSKCNRALSSEYTFGSICSSRRSGMAIGRNQKSEYHNGAKEFSDGDLNIDEWNGKSFSNSESALDIPGYNRLPTRNEKFPVYSHSLGNQQPTENSVGYQVYPSTSNLSPLEITNGYNSFLCPYLQPETSIFPSGYKPLLVNPPIMNSSLDRRSPVDKLSPVWRFFPETLSYQSYSASNHVNNVTLSSIVSMNVNNSSIHHVNHNNMSDTAVNKNLSRHGNNNNISNNNSNSCLIENIPKCINYPLNLFQKKPVKRKTDFRKKNR